MKERLAHFLNPFDGRYEDLTKGQLGLNIFRDFTAGLIVALVAIPLAMGFAMASGLRPEQGIVGGAIAGLIGALFGGSKYQVYGPTAAFIPVIGGIMATYDFSFLVLASITSGAILCVMGLSGLGRLAKLVPHSIIVGFTIGIALVIATSQIGEVLGLKLPIGSSTVEKLKAIALNFHHINLYAIAIAGITFYATKTLLKVSVYIPAPLIGIAAGTLMASTVWRDKGLTLVQDKYGSIPTNFWVFTPPTSLPTFNATLAGDLGYYVLAIVFVAAVESILCSRMADRLAGNQGIPFDPNKELWGQGMVNLIIPLFNGFPHTGALARTATNIKVGALSPLAGIFKCILKLVIAAYLASYLQLVPMACLGGILLFVATAMVKPAEVQEVLAFNRFHVGLMVVTAILVLFTDFLTGVLSGLLIYGIAKFKFPWVDDPDSKGQLGIAKIMNGVLKFKRNTLPAYRETFSSLATQQKPQVYFITCSDSRVVPDLVSNSKPGEMFVSRNVGNLVPEFQGALRGVPEEASIEFAVNDLAIKDIIVCGHSNCGAMKAVLAKESRPPLEKWLKHAQPAYEKFLRAQKQKDMPDEDRLSQANVLQQLRHLQTYPNVQSRINSGELRVHGWWFEIRTATIYTYDWTEQDFFPVDAKRVRTYQSKLPFVRPDLVVSR